MTTKLCYFGDYLLMLSMASDGIQHMYPRDQRGAEMAADMYFGQQQHI